MKEYRSKEIYGAFYENEGKPLVVLIGGSRPGLPAPLSDDLMNYLIPNYNVLLLAYFGVGEISKSLENIPIEYFKNAITIVKEEYNIPDNKVAVIGQSKGGEAALLLANQLNSALTIACVASCYVWQGLPEKLQDMGKTEPKSSWSLNNEPLPYIRFHIDEEALRNAANKKFCKCYENSIERYYDEKALINMDNYTGKILLLSAENDAYWPSKKMSDILIQNSKNKENISHTCLNLEGHYFLNYVESVREIINSLKANFS